MASNWKWYEFSGDPDVPADVSNVANYTLASDTLTFTHPNDLSVTEKDKLLAFMNIIDDPADSGLYKEEAYLDFDGTTPLTPGTSSLILRVIDADGADVFATTDMKMATTEAGLGSAVGGADLDVGTEIISGVSNALFVWFRCTNSETTLNDKLAYTLRWNGRTGNTV